MQHCVLGSFGKLTVDRIPRVNCPMARNNANAEERIRIGTVKRIPIGGHITPSVSSSSKLFKERPKSG